MNIRSATLLQAAVLFCVVVADGLGGRLRRPAAANGRRGDRGGRDQGSARDRIDARHAAARIRGRATSRPQRLLRHGAADRQRPNHLAAVRRGLHDRTARAAADRQGAGDRHRQRLPGGRAQPAGQRRLHDRDRQAAGRARRAHAQAARTTTTSTPRSATAIRAGPSTRRSTRSSSPARPRKCRSRWSTSCAKGGG